MLFALGFFFKASFSYQLFGRTALKEEVENMTTGIFILMTNH